MLANDKGKSKAEVTSWTGYPGGAPCNVACGLGKLGVPVAFVSSLGNDAKGSELLELMQSMFASPVPSQQLTSCTLDCCFVCIKCVTLEVSIRT